MVTEATRRLIDERLAAETGRPDTSAAFRVALAYPSPYAVAMSSLGFQWIYRALHRLPGVGPERVFLADGGDRPGAAPETPASYESLRALGDFPLVAFSIAYELELAGLVRMLAGAGIPELREARDGRSPLIVAGGPLTFANAALLAPLVDAVVVGEAEGIVEQVVEAVRAASTRAEALLALSHLPHVYVPEHHGASPPPAAAAAAERLPAFSTIRTPHTDFADMWLVEPERGCSRTCNYCVMRRCPGRTMRVVPRELVLELLPADVRRVGLVGAAVSDHPQITELVTELAARGCTVGLSSLRPDRLSDELVGALRGAGYRTLTTALDGASQRLREGLGRRCHDQHFVRAAELARQHGMARLKLYLMLGVPGETDEDLDECVRFVSELSRILPIALGVAPFCAKRGTPLDGAPYAGVRTLTARLKHLHRGLRGRAAVRATSARFGWVEHVLAQGGSAEALAVARAAVAGGRFADYRREFARLGHHPDRSQVGSVG